MGVKLLEGKSNSDERSCTGKYSGDLSYFIKREREGKAGRALMKQHLHKKTTTLDSRHWEMFFGGEVG